MKYGKVSIIVPVYQSKKYITTCINSILNQTYKNYEVILIDDGSNDGSEVICDYLSRNNPFVTSIHQFNKGVSAARNNGINFATGNYLLFVDSDDYIEPIMLEEMIDKMERSNADIVYCNYSRVYLDREIELQPEVEEKSYKVEEFIDVFFKLIDLSIVHNIGTKLYRADLIKGNSICFDERYSICEDILFCLEATRKSNVIFYLNKALYNYSINNKGSLVSAFKPNYYLAHKELMLNMQSYLKEHNRFKSFANKYYRRYMDGILNVISHEISFGNNINSIAFQIKQDEFSKEAALHIKKNVYKDLTIKEKIYYSLTWKNRFFLLRFLLKMRYFIKRYLDKLQAVRGT